VGIAGETLRIESAASIVLECKLGALDMADVLLPLVPDQKAFSIDQFPGQPARPVATNAETCYVSNYGRVPALDVKFDLYHFFFFVRNPGHTVDYAMKDGPVEIRGIAPERTKVLRVENESTTLCAAVYDPQVVSFVQPPVQAEVPEGIPVTAGPKLRASAALAGSVLGAERQRRYYYLVPLKSETKNLSPLPALGLPPINC
jgi:hypothetical protein